MLGWCRWWKEKRTILRGMIICCKLHSRKRYSKGSIIFFHQCWRHLFPTHVVTRNMWPRIREFTSFKKIDHEIASWVFTTLIHRSSNPTTTLSITLCFIPPHISPTHIRPIHISLAHNSPPTFVVVGWWRIRPFRWWLYRLLVIFWWTYYFYNYDDVYIILMFYKRIISLSI